MSRAMPPHIPASHLAGALSYRWDEEVEQEVLFRQARIADRITAMSYRAALAFALGSVEWIVYRLKPELEDDVPFQLLDAAWAALVDWRYLKHFDLPEWEMHYDRRVGGPLGHGFWLLRESFVAAREGNPFNDMPVSISEIALRVSGDPESFKPWRRSCIKRLIAAYPKNPEERLGPPVPRDVLDPSYVPSPAADAERIARYLTTLDWNENPFLRRPDDSQADDRP